MRQMTLNETSTSYGLNLAKMREESPDCLMYLKFFLLYNRISDISERTGTVFIDNFHISFIRVVEDNFQLSKQKLIGYFSGLC